MLEIEDVNIEEELKKSDTLDEVKTEEVQDVKAEEVKTEEVKTEEEKEKKGDPAVALRLARKEARELKEQIRLKEAEQAERYKKLEERLERLQNPTNQPKFEEDPANFLKNEVEEVKKTVAPFTQQAKQQQIEVALERHLRTAETEFRKENPDYDDATTYLVKSMSANAQLFGHDPNIAVRNEVLRITALAAQTGKDPAEILFNLAKNNGYVKKQPPPQKLETIEKGQEVAKSLGNGARKETGALTLEALSTMPDEEFDALVSDPKRWSQVGQMMH